METTTALQPQRSLSPTELEQLRPAIAARYPEARGVLGSQLGAFIRRHLSNPDLKGRFGGLKGFVAHYFPAEIIWRGRKGLDDLYDVSFGQAEAGTNGAWQPVALETSIALWSAVSNPSIFVQFAWSPTKVLLLQASAGVPLTNELVAVEKLTKSDYQRFAVEFIDTQEGIDQTFRQKGRDAAGASSEFTRIVREQGLLAKWEAFRVDQALNLFAERIAAAGAGAEVAARWIDVLRSSQQAARAAKVQRTAFSVAQGRQQRPANRDYERDGAPDPRLVAIKAMEFLSDSELSNLSLPLGSVMRAVDLLLKRP